MDRYSFHKWILFRKLPVLYEYTLNLFGYREAVERFFSNTTKNFDSKIILDVGCGSGLVSLTIARTHRDSTIIGIDKSIKMLKLSQRFSEEDKLRNTFFIRSDLNKSCPIRDESVDLIVTSGFLEYIKLDTTLKELYRCLKKNGSFIILAIKNNIYGRIIGLIYGFKPFDEKVLIGELEEAGFKDIEKISFREEKWLSRTKVSFIARKT